MLVRDTRGVAVTYAARTLLGSRSATIAVLSAGLLALTGAPASAAGGRCAAGQALTTCAGGVVGGIVNPGTCASQTPSYQVPPSDQTPADRLQSLIDYVPCPQTGRVSFGTHDNTGESMSVLDPLPSPTGGYIGVYHSEFRRLGAAPGADFRISLARSRDLIHWTRLAILDPHVASMPTLSTIAGGPGYLLAYEKRAPDGGNVVRVRYYGSLGALAANRFVAQSDLPRAFSPFNDGTPTILWAYWNGGLRRSAIGIGFHYETAPDGRRGPDREAVGTLRGFRRWSAHTDPATDFELDRQGYTGSHGDWRQFYFDRSRWRVYEAQSAFNDFGAWHVILDSPSSGRMYPVEPTMGARPVSNSFANPVTHVEPAPQGGGRVLVVTMFLFDARGPAAPGELVYYQPI